MMNHQTSKTVRFTMLAAVLGVMTALAACNTVEGVGKDIKSGGKAIEETADDAKN